ncbi:MAG: response regulator transcription factor [Hyphomicrobiaceae bacterium]|nr:response regulator transcription factor [Hyphomicrobiaceae bacterium]
MRAHCQDRVVTYPTVDRWLGSKDYENTSIVVYSIGRKLTDAAIEEEIALLTHSTEDIPMALLSDDEDLDDIVEALDHGARGYITTSLPLKIAVEALRLVQAGGVYVPASGLMAAKRAPDEASPQRFYNGIFTARQAAVVEALRRGKANKIIAYELNMRESTVKVHVRSIMKKLKAKNRTEVAFLANGFLNGDVQLSG